MPKSKEVDAWMTRYENPMKPVVQRVREILLGADKRIDECIKWQAPTFTYRGNLASFFPKSKQHASLMFHMGATIPGKHPRLEGQGDTARVMKIASVAEANAAKRDLERLVAAWCAMQDASAAPSKPKASKGSPKTTSKKATKRATKSKAPAGPRSKKHG